MSSSSLPSDDSMLLTAASLPSTGVSTRPRRLSASSQHRRRASDVQRFSSAKTPALIATLNYGRAAVSPSASVPTRSTTTEAQSPTSPSFKNPDLYGGSGGISGRRKGVIFRCETCNKVYRHPSCLIKHRWEHSPHWANSAKVPLSKHQQVQLLEGATILAHLSGSAALPEDRAVWPSWTSGGSLPLPTGTRDPLAKDELGEDGSDDDGEIQEEDDLLQDESAIIDEDDEDEGELAISASVQDGAGLRRSLRPRSRSTGSMLNGVGRTVRSGGVAKAIPRKSGPVKAGFSTPSHARVTQVAPGVFVAPSPEAPGSPAHPGLSFTEARTGASAPISISIPPRLGTSSIAASLEPTSPTVPSQSLGTSYGVSGLAVLASLSLGAEPSSILSPPPTSSDLSFSSSSGRRGFSSSLPQSSVRSSSSGGDSDELREIDEDEDDVDMDGDEQAAQRKRAEEEWDGMDLEMDDL